MNTMRVAWLLAVAVAIGGIATDLRAQTPPPVDLALMSLEDLMRISVTSASRKEQRLADVPAAIYVITEDDIRRSGLHTLPELLRLAPGVQVAQISSSNWSVSIRGFGNLLSDKLLVLIDGRSLYNRAFSGLFWDTQDLLLDDIDRIEVVRGPGGVMWGSNAVNGVINIVTKSSADTGGTLVRIGGGGLDRAQAAVRYGGALGTATYRVYSQWSEMSDSKLADGRSANDPWNRSASAVRIDWSRGRDAWMVDTNVLRTAGHPLWSAYVDATPGALPVNDGTMTQLSGATVGRWIRSGTNDRSLQVQVFAAFSNRIDTVEEYERTYDLDVHYRTKVGQRHDLVLGGGIRDGDNRTEGSFTYSLAPGAGDSTVFNTFVQDEITLTNQLHVTLGSRVEHDTIASWGVQPTARVSWNIGAGDQHVWAAVSRALRTPSAADLGVRLNYVAVPGNGLPILIGAIGNPNYRTEELLDVEAGYRVAWGTKASIDATAFRGHYDRLRTNEPQPPVFETTPGPPHVFIATQYENLLQADTTGFEIAAHAAPLPAWRLDGSFSGFHLAPHPDATSQDTAAGQIDGDAPAHQWQLRSTLNLGTRTQVDASVFHVGELHALGVPAYTRMDARLQFSLSKALTAIAAGKNLFDPAHLEFGGATGTLVTFVPRSADLQLVWRFK